MTLEVLQKEMVAAMKAHDKVRKNAISSLIGAIKKVAIDERRKDNIDEELVNRVIMKEKKMIQDMIDTCPADREELLTEYKQRMTVIEEFVPKMMTEEEIRQTIDSLITENEGIDLKNKGSIMRIISPKLKGKADMKLVNQIVTDICLVNCPKS